MSSTKAPTTCSEIGATLLSEGFKKYITFLMVYKITDVTLQQPTLQTLTGGRESMQVAAQQTQILREEGKEP
jgi:hypothetical protein